ncbi:MAG: hypothetical protein QXG00_03665 [Candidatus Woesearchaeota archaeon]
MVRIKNRFIFIGIILLILLLNVLIRIPLTISETGTDSFLIHSIAASIYDTQYIAYSLHPLSMFGYYPYSYASAVPILLTEFSKISGIELNFVVIAFGILCSIIGIFSMMLLSRLLLDDDLFVIFSVFFYSYSLSYLYWTNYSVATRGFFLSILPFYIYVFYKLLLEKKTKYLVLSILLLIVLALTHHLFLFVLGYSIIFGISYLIYVSQIFTKYVNRISPFITGSIFATIIILITLLPYYLSIFSNISLYNVSIIKNIFTDLIIYLRAVGFHIILSFICFVWILFKKEKKFIDITLLCSLIFFAFFIKATIYIPQVLLLLFSITAAYALISFISIFKKQTQVKIFFGLVLIIVSTATLFQIWHPAIINPRAGIQGRSADLIDIQLGYWVIENIDGNVINTDYITQMRLSSMSYCQFIFWGENAVSCNLIKKTDINITRLSIFNYKSLLDYPYKVYPSEFENYIRWVVSAFDISQYRTSKFFYQFNIKALIINNKLPTRNLKLPSSLTYNNKIYDSGNYEIVYLN